MKYNTIVIGGGLAGLTTAATLSKFGKKVLLLEQHYKPGGCATTFKRGDFIVEVGLHEMSGLAEGSNLSNIFKMLEVDKNVEFLQVPEFYGVLSDKEDFVLPHGYGAATKALVDKYPNEKKAIKKFMKLIAGIRKESMNLPRSPFMRKLIYPLMPLLSPNLVTATRETIGSWLDKNIKSEELKLDMTAHVGYWGDDPYNLALLYFGLPLAGFIECGGHFVKGGSQELSNSLAAFIEKQGGTVLLGKTAEKIVTENGKATGVTFRDVFDKEAPSVTISCDNVVANAAIPTVPDLLDEPYASELKKKIGSYTNSTSLLCMYLGFNQKVDKFGVKYYSNFIKGDDVKRLRDVHPNQLGDWKKRSFIFVDYKKVDAGLAPPDKAAGVICAIDHLRSWEGLSEQDYKAKKEEVAETLLQRLDDKFPGIRESIEYYEVSTPKTIKRYTLNPSGAVYGFAQTLQMTGGKRFRNNILIPNLYFASAWAFPGGGFEGSITAGFLAALQMTKDKIWSDVDAEKYVDHRVVKFKSSKLVDDNTIELNFEKPAGFKNENGEYTILKLKDPKVMELDLPYRWLPLTSNGEDEQLRFQMMNDGSSFARSCEQMEVGDEAIVFGPMV
ncbi:phytoene desaturase family protein [Flagellimonas meridianipacifica]|uniref:Phytoene dehydrogenase-like protein n=1 Tax=Flagellimonas meridianipacifica TaxID=1080225 RepID=A0A2T0MBN1_9FLAO|nr:NAD(P)/FAD-dependent oxidoreductase [Allomuricauda pacifica]PRX54907.1 phytoene dehydrogenase-like protein [Allomuricauda pacifica]